MFSVQPGDNMSVWSGFVVASGGHLRDGSASVGATAAGGDLGEPGPGAEPHDVAAMGRQAQHMAANYYPSCPQPELAYGLPGHKQEPNAITLLLRDGVSGLQVQRNGRWMAVYPVPNALVTDIGALSNDRYKSASEILLVVGDLSPPPSSLSSTTSSSPSPCVPAAGSTSGGNYAPAVGQDGTGGRDQALRLSSVSLPHVPPATTAVTTDEDVSKLDLAIVACTFAIVVPVLLHIGDLTSSWGKGWKWLYALSTCLSFTSPLISIFTASPGSRARRFSSACARFGLVVASALFIVFIPCNLGLGCAAGVAPAAVIVAILTVLWIWSSVEAEPASRAEAVAEDGASLPDDAP